MSNLAILLTSILIACLTSSSVNARTVDKSELKARFGKVCNIKEAKVADLSMDQQTTWPKIHSQYLSYRHCDIGVVAQDFDDLISRSLANDWAGFIEGKIKWKKNKKFIEFVIQHVNVVAHPDDLNMIRENARKKCPQTQTKICKSIENAAENAIVMRDKLIKKN
jgi:hypothetical protein